MATIRGKFADGVTFRREACTRPEH